MSTAPSRSLSICAKHWLQGARHCPSPFFNARPQGEISLSVIHNISLPPGQFGGSYIDKLFTGQLSTQGHPYFAEIAGIEVSAHVLIRRDGELVQYVAFDQRAWHAGKSSYLGRDNCNDYAIGIELEGCDDQPFNDSQYDALNALLAVLAARYPALQGAVTGHSDIAPGRKTDPGPCFDWSRVHAAALRVEALVGQTQPHGVKT
ncbi:MAG: 1,6-anhydro-N-acetylmuramyl-L-alanine amidase AmpD [Paraperlucidibaca sp.]